MGNQSSEVVKKAYQSSHFVILPSNSEGWPKAIAEGMFWGCIPLATAVSCVPNMLDFGKRGVLLAMQLEQDSKEIFTLLQDATKQETQRKAAADWSRAYTIERFENEIQLLLQP
jgi:glycosyltransferase involved in cell wall biosynthesis